MTSIQSRLPFAAIILWACIVLFFSLWDIFYEKQWLQTILALYGILLILTIVLLFTKTTKKPTGVKSKIEEFEKTLGGELYHFKCPNCNRIFAIKKSKRNNKKPFTLTCPDCGTVGKVPPTPKLVEEEVPKQKSEKTEFKCRNCGERVSIWAEGTDIIRDMQVYSCPYCGKKQPMKNI